MRRAWLGPERRANAIQMDPAMAAGARWAERVGGSLAAELDPVQHMAPPATTAT